MEYITHPYITPDRVEKRTYQFNIAMKALDGNTLVVIPTGLGKTAIALITAASRLYSNGGKILMLAPTKPLVEQHLRYFQTHLQRAGEETLPFTIFTGEAPPKTRTQEWDKASLIFATPQVVKNDLIAGRYDLSDVTLLIVDEAHRSVGNYAYVFLAGRYMETAREPLILAMTASPGSNTEKISDIVENLQIALVETRSEDDPDVKPYIHEKDIEIIPVDLPDELQSVLDDLYSLIDDRLAQLRHMGYFAPDRKNLSMRTLQELNTHIQQKIAEKDATGFTAASIHAECMKLKHAVGLAESQGCLVLKRYLNKLLSEGTTAGGSKASRRIAEDPRFIRLLERSIGWEEECHPKLLILPKLIEDIFEDSDTRVIIFATYRDTVKMIVDILIEKGIPAERFVGQAKKDQEKGLSQKKQIETIKRFREGEFRVLVATSVGEEGLDIPSTDVVIFYEPVPSEIRSIQRKGRTGRHGTGRIIVLMTKKTSDETFRFVSQNREKAMAKAMHKIGHREKNEYQAALNLISPANKAAQDDYFSGPTITIDDRELNSRVVELLSDGGAVIRIERLVYGDFLIGDRICVERKTTRDFLDSLIDRDLLDQIRLMASNCSKPLLIIEGESLFGLRDIHPNAIRGALAAIMVNFNVPVIQTSGPEDTSDMLLVLSRREADNEHSERGNSQKKTYEGNDTILEGIIASFPDIGISYARKMLKEFGSIQGIINAEEEELMRIVGMGEKKAKRVYELSRLLYSG